MSRKRKFKTIWDLKGTLKKYAKGKSFDWRKMRREAERYASERHVRALQEPR